MGKHDREMAQVSTAQKEINQSIQSPPSSVFKHRTVFLDTALSSCALVLAPGLDVLRLLQYYMTFDHPARLSHRTSP